MLARGARVRLFLLVVSVGLCGFCRRRCVGCHVVELRVFVIVMSEKEGRKKKAYFLLVVVSFADYEVIYYAFWFIYLLRISLSDAVLWMFLSFFY